MTEGIILFVALALPAGLLAMKYWRQTLFGVFVLLIVEGALRKWVFPWASAPIYLLKDAILLAVYLGFLLNGPVAMPFRFRGVTLIKALLTVSFIFGVVEVFNPDSPSILVGLNGLKVYFLYVPLMFVLPYAFKSQEHFISLIKWYLVIAIPIAVLGFVQSAAGPESSLNMYVSSTEEPAALSRFGQDELVRTSGTFSYISGYTAYLTFIAFLAIGYNLTKGWRLGTNLVGILGLTLVIGAMFTTGSRTPIYVLLGTSPIVLGSAVIRGLLPLQTAVRLFLAVPIIAVGALSISPRTFDAFMERVNNPVSDNASSRLTDTVSETVDALSNAPALGFGIGTAHPASLMIMGAQWWWWLGDSWKEAEMARVTTELGVVGLILIYVSRILIAIWAVRSTVSFTDPVYRAFGIVLAIYLGLSILQSVIFDATAGLYYWGAAGLVMTMCRFHAEKQRRSTLLIRPDGLRLSAVHANKSA